MLHARQAASRQELRRHPPIQRSAVAFMRGVWALQSTVRIPAPARAASNAAVKSGPRSRIMNLTRCGVLAEVHDQVAGLLGGPFPGWMQSGSQDADAPAGVLDHGQDVSRGAIEQVRREEITCQDRLGLGAQEQRPGRAGPPRRRIDAGLSSGSPIPSTPRSCPQPGQFPVDPAVAQPGFLRASHRTRALMFRRVAGRPVLPRIDRRPSGGGRYRGASARTCPG